MKKQNFINVNIGDGKYTTLIMGQSPEGESYNKDGVGLPFYQGSKDFGELYPVPRVWCSNPRKIAIKGDIILGVRAPVGDTNLVVEKSAIGRGVAIVRCSNLIITDYVFFVLKAVKKILNKESTGSVTKAISKDDIKKIKFSFPESKINQKIIIDQFQKKNLIINDLEKELIIFNNNISDLQSSILAKSFGIKIV
jgi:type I restriction enzyme S subunit